MFIEPIIDIESFKKDYGEGLSAKDIKEKYKLTPRQYRRILADYNLTRDYEFLKQNPHLTWKAKYYSIVGKKYCVRKVFGSIAISYGSYIFEEEAKYIVKELKKENWDKRKLNIIIENMKTEEWYMNLYNEKIRSIRTTIEAEQMKDKPNYDNIKKLERELRKLLKEVD